MIQLIPRPVRDMVTAPSDTKKAYQGIHQMGIGGQAIIGMFGGGRLTLPPAERMAKAALRISLAALGAFFALKMSWHLGACALLGGMVSLPATAIAFGTYFLGIGLCATKTALAKGTLSALATCLGGIVGGYLTLEAHDIVPFGVGEIVIDRAAKTLAPSIAIGFVPRLEGGFD
jgi:hypothetical protein